MKQKTPWFLIPFVFILGLLVPAILARLFSNNNPPSTSALSNSLSEPDTHPLPTPPQDDTPTEDQQGPQGDETSNDQQLDPENDSKINWDVIGFASVAVSLASAAIFFFAGWVYEAHWYSYYGISIRGVNLIPTEVMVQGLPGLMLLTISILIAIVIIIIWIILQNYLNSIQSNLNGNHWNNSLRSALFGNVYDWNNLLRSALIGEETDVSEEPIRISISQNLISVQHISSIFISASLIAFLFLFIFIFYSYVDAYNAQGFTFTLEFIITLIASLLLLIFSISLVPNTVRGLTNIQLKYIASEFGAVGVMLVDKLVPEIERLQTLIRSSLKEVWKFWLGFFLLFLLLISVSFSSLLGEHDARKARRTLSANWQIPKTTIYANQPILALKNHIIATECVKNNLGDSSCVYAYGPLGNLMVSENEYYFVSLKGNGSYQEPPELYIIPKSENRILDLAIPQPTATPTFTPSPTNTPTPVPTQTPTPSISSTEISKDS